MTESKPKKLRKLDFDRLGKKHPEFATAWASLREWFSRNEHLGYAPIPTIVAGAANGDEGGLIVPLSLILDQRMARVTYRMADRDGQLLEGEYEDVGDIPKTISVPVLSAATATTTQPSVAFQTVPRNEGILVGVMRWDV